MTRGKTKYEIDAHFIVEWLESLNEESQELVTAATDLLSIEGPNLKRPLVGKITGSRFKNMKELRPASSGKSEIRILFIFDPDRQAILLLGGDKSQGKNKWKRWYNKNIPIAEARYQQHLQSLAKKKRAK